REHCADGFADDPFYEADAHGVDLPVSIHQGVHPEYLEKGTAGIIDYFKKQLLSKWLQSTELLVVCYDRQDLVPVIKGHEQLGRTEKLRECSRPSTRTQRTRFLRSSMGHGFEPMARRRGTESPPTSPRAC
ncbi:unnamed protein product, partial [Ectocarpus sp. 8 AP-2014]